MKGAFEMVVIGGSAGSLAIVLELLPFFKPEMEIAILLVFHRKSDDGTLIDILSHRSHFDVKEVEDKEVTRAGVVYVAPADYHVLVEKDGSLSLDYSEKINFSRPSIDVTFESASDVYGRRLVGILLSGANADGTNGLYKISKAGGLVIVQDPKTAEVPYMPAAALAKTSADIMYPTKMIDVVNRIFNSTSKSQP
jgi:two-component system, chemotaxis family, protein-glutamate methylesterase/glutaminase